MSHTNSTTHYNLPQFVGTDTPGWLTDVNSAMSSIDAAVYARQQEAAANSDAITANTADITTLQGRMSTAESSITALDSASSSHGASIDNINQSLATVTSDVAALSTRVTNLDGADIAYDHTGTDLEAATVQAAITEVNDKVAHPAEILWTHPDGLDPQGLNGNTTITLSSGDYTYLEVEFKATNGAADPHIFQKFLKGYDISIFYASASGSSSSDTFIMSRILHRVSDTEYNADLGQLRRMSNAGNSVDYFAIPVRIWGIK